MDVDAKALEFPHPSSFLLAGKTGSGKTHFIQQYLQHTPHKFDTVQICSREPQAEYPKSAVYHPPGVIPQGLYESFNPQLRNLLIIDDLFSEAFASEEVKQIFVSGRHRNITVFLTSQNIFPPGGKHARNISLNANYIILFRTRDLHQLGVLSRQIFGKKTLIQEAYNDAIVKNNFRYLVVDCSNHHNIEVIRLRTNIFAERPEMGVICYE